jgi:D-alanine-D-alanine ligase
MALVEAQALGKVAVLLGGNSAERSISLQTGAAILQALLNYGVQAHAIDTGEVDFIAQLQQGQFDRVFIALHGKDGEDGIIQGLLEALQLPYTGSGVAASALAMDKARAKLILQALALPTPAFRLAHTLSQAHLAMQALGMPLSIKPVAEGSSMGITCLNDSAQLASAYYKAAKYGPVLLEPWIYGKDIFVGVLGDKVLPPVQVNLASGFYDYQAKYTANNNQYLCPAPLDRSQMQQLTDLAYQAYAALGCQGWGRVDIIQDGQGQFWILEVNTIPGMTPQSLLPKAAAAVGFSFEELVVTILMTTLPCIQQRAQALG